MDVRDGLLRGSEGFYMWRVYGGFRGCFYVGR